MQTDFESNAVHCFGCLQGYAGLQQAHHITPQEQQHQAVQGAVGHLFQAAAVFSAADQAAHYGEQADLTASCHLVQQVVQDILLALTGRSERSDPQVCKLKLKLVMRLLCSFHSSLQPGTLQELLDSLWLRRASGISVCASCAKSGQRAQRCMQ